MSTDLELEAWREQWQAPVEEPIPAELRRKVERQSRLMKIGLVCDALVTLVIGGGSTAWAVMSRDPGMALVAVASWLFLAAAWMFVIVANRGIWEPTAVDAATFLDLSVRRCQAALTGVWFAATLFVAEIVFGLSWAYLHMEGRPPIARWLLFGSVRIDIVWLCTIVFFAALVWYRSRKRRELAQLLNLSAEITPKSM